MQSHLGKLKVGLLLAAIGMTACSPSNDKPDCNALSAQLLKGLADLNSIEAGLKMHKLNKGEYPDSLDAMVPDILSKLSLDPWGNPYLYQLDDSGKYQLESKGITLSFNNVEYSQMLNANSDVASIIDEVREKSLCN